MNTNDRALKLADALLSRLPTASLPGAREKWAFLIAQEITEAKKCPDEGWTKTSFFLETAEALQKERDEKARLLETVQQQLDAEKWVSAKLAEDRDYLKLQVESLKKLALEQIPHRYEGDCPYKDDINARDPECPACKILGPVAVNRHSDYLPDHPELLKGHPLTCGDCGAKIRTDLCIDCLQDGRCTGCGAKAPPCLCRELGTEPKSEKRKNDHPANCVCKFCGPVF
jgi:hypothetical protein